MAPLAVDPEVLDSAGSSVISVGEGLGSTISTLTNALAGFNAMSGDDPAGAAFGRSYDTSASKLLEAMVTTRNGLCRLGDGVRVSAHNYSLAEVNSNISGRAQPLPGPLSTGVISAGSTPSSVGSGIHPPAGWGWVSKYIGMIWPTGDPAKLRGAAAAWTTAGTTFEVSEITGDVGPMSSIGAQQIPEGPAIAAAFTETNHCAAGVLQQSSTIATHLAAYATKIDAVHAAIIDLLSRICNPATGFKIVWEFLTDDDENEIHKIANDIRVIVDQFTAEVEALSQQIAIALHRATEIVSTMIRYAEKEWDHFLHSTDIGRALDHFGHICSGAFSEAESTLESMWSLSPARAAVDPKGFWHSVSDALDRLGSLTGLDGEQKFEDSWEEFGKDVVHWDEWATDPFKAAGETLFDIATVAVPGGALTKLPKLERLVGEIGEAPKGPPVPSPSRMPNPAPHDNPPPRNDTPRGGQPAPKPGNSLPPYGLTESKAPADPKPAPGALPKPLTESITAEHMQPNPPDASHGSAVKPPAFPSNGGAATGYLPPSTTTTSDHHGPVAHHVAQVPTPTLTAEDCSALADYTGLGHEDLNDALRIGTMDASQQARVDAINQALQKLPPYEGPVYRGTDLPPDVLALYQPGAAVTEPAFFSTSTNPAVPQSTAFSGNVEFRVVSRTGRDISSLSTFPTEEEVLFPTAATFFVLSRRSDPLSGTVIVEMIER